MALELSDHYTQLLSTSLTNLSNMPQESKEDNFKEENKQGVTGGADQTSGECSLC